MRNNESIGVQCKKVIKCNCTHVIPGLFHDQLDCEIFGRHLARQSYFQWNVLITTGLDCRKAEESKKQDQRCHYSPFHTSIIYHNLQTANTCTPHFNLKYLTKSSTKLSKPLIFTLSQLRRCHTSSFHFTQIE